MLHPISRASDLLRHTTYMCPDVSGETSQTYQYFIIFHPEFVHVSTLLEIALYAIIACHRFRFNPWNLRVDGIHSYWRLLWIAWILMSILDFCLDLFGTFVGSMSLSSDSKALPDRLRSSRSFCFLFFGTITYSDVALIRTMSGIPTYNQTIYGMEVTWLSRNSL